MLGLLSEWPWDARRRGTMILCALCGMALMWCLSGCAQGGKGQSPSTQGESAALQTDDQTAK